MIAFINNLSFGELLLIAAIGLLLYGRRLPEIAAQAAAKFEEMRRHLQDLRRDVGIDQEIQNARRAMADLKRETSLPRIASAALSGATPTPSSPAAARPVVERAPPPAAPSPADDPAAKPAAESSDPSRLRDER